MRYASKSIEPHSTICMVRIEKNVAQFCVFHRANILSKLVVKHCPTHIIGVPIVLTRQPWCTVPDIQSCAKTNLQLFKLRRRIYLLQSAQSGLSEGGQRGQQSVGSLEGQAPVLQLQHSAFPPAPALSAASWLPALHVAHCESLQVAVGYCDSLWVTHTEYMCADTDKLELAEGVSSF